MNSIARFEGPSGFSFDDIITISDGRCGSTISKSRGSGVNGYLLDCRDVLWAETRRPALTAVPAPRRYMNARRETDIAEVLPWFIRTPLNRDVLSGILD